MIEGKTHLADLWAQNGLVSAIKNGLGKTEEALERNSLEVAETHLGKSLDLLEKLSKTLVSERLTDFENEEWKILRDKEWDTMTKRDGERLKYLQAKASGLMVGKLKTASLNFNPEISERFSKYIQEKYPNLVGRGKKV